MMGCQLSGNKLPHSRNIRCSMPLTRNVRTGNKGTNKTNKESRHLLTSCLSGRGPPPPLNLSLTAKSPHDPASMLTGHGKPAANAFLLQDVLLSGGSGGRGSRNTHGIGSLRLRAACTAWLSRKAVDRQGRERRGPCLLQSLVHRQLARRQVVSCVTKRLHVLNSQTGRTARWAVVTRVTTTWTTTVPHITRACNMLLGITCC